VTLRNNKSVRPNPPKEWNGLKSSSYGTDLIVGSVAGPSVSPCSSYRYVDIIGSEVSREFDGTSSMTSVLGTWKMISVTFNDSVLCPASRALSTLRPGNTRSLLAIESLVNGLRSRFPVLEMLNCLALRSSASTYASFHVQIPWLELIGSSWL
jgi:hypothetical protein